jgi:hypothetical protein
MRSPETKVQVSAPKKSVPLVKGPIRCHKCQLKCQDAEEYLSHTCEPRRNHL